MNRNTTTILMLILLTLLSCKNDSQSSDEPSNKLSDKKENKFPELRKLSEFKNTEFIPTLEHKISDDKNYIYCSTFLFAWDEIRNKINSQLTIPDQNYDLKLVNQSKSFEGVLQNHEYEASGKIDGNRIIANARFNKSLPFEVKLQSFDDKLTFKGQKVSSFGILLKDIKETEEIKEMLEVIKIVYYKDDSNFILRLLPKDEAHEIIVFKTENRGSSIAEMVTEIKKLTKIGEREKMNDSINWKYFYAEDDVVIIPKINFNIETNYKSIEENRFSSEKQNFQIEKAWQNTAFILDENGADIESESEVIASIGGYRKPEPKKMIVDKSFLILLKRKNAKNPYFGLWTTNTELMSKEK